MFIQSYLSLEDGRTKISYSEPGGDGNKPDNKMICENAAPKESFTEAVKDAKALYKTLAEQSADVKDITIKKIAFTKTGKGEITKVSFVGLVGLAKSTGSNEVKSQEYYASQLENSAGKNVLTAPQIAVVDSVISECKDYIAGDRLQIEADLETEPKEDLPEDSEY